MYYENYIRVFEKYTLKYVPIDRYSISIYRDILYLYVEIDEQINRDNDKTNEGYINNSGYETLYFVKILTIIPFVP